jgi:RNA polymerase sigma-70 factor (ECF subfamily)
VDSGHKPLSQEVHELAAHLFRHQAGQMLASLTRVLGWEAADTAEEIVQEALVAALETWPYRGIPEEPGAWLWSVAVNKAKDRLRHAQVAKRKLAVVTRELEARRESPPTNATGPTPPIVRIGSCSLHGRA